jgi:hypothetical protein
MMTMPTKLTLATHDEETNRQHNYNDCGDGHPVELHEIRSPRVKR